MSLTYQVLPILLAMDPEARKIAPATVYFILLSSVILSVALWQFSCHVIHDESTVMVYDAPNQLLGCAASHLQVLVLKTAQESEHATGLVQSIHAILSSLCSGLPVNVDGALDELAHFRWHEGGSGIRRLPRGAVGGLVQVWSSGLKGYTAQPVQLPPIRSMEMTESRKDAIRSLCSPAARICRPGCFDLSIQF